MGMAVNISETLALKSTRHTVNTKSAPSKRLAVNYRTQALLAWSLCSRNINLRPTVEGEKP